VATGRFRRQYRDHRLEWMIRNGGFEVVAEGLRRDNIRFNTFP
jgi:glutathione S-transferase/RNA polymerase-associated protein